MTLAVSDWLLVPLLCFCRVGSCLMLVPWISSGRVPVRFRLSLCLGLSLMVAMLVGAEIMAALEHEAQLSLTSLVVSETATGLAFGFTIRIMFSAALSAGVLAATMLGLSAPVSPALDEAESAPPPADLLQVASVVFFLQCDLHLELISALLQSYEALPIMGGFSGQFWLHKSADATRDMLMLSVRLVAPLVIMALVTNLALGLAGRMLPMLPVQFLGVPLVLVVGLFTLGRTAQDLSGGIVAEFARWLARG